MPLPTVLDELDRLFDELIRRPWGSPRELKPSEVQQVEDGWIIKLPVEGWSADDLQLHAQGNWLTITGHRRRSRERKHGEGGWSQTQQEYTLRQTIALPPGGDPEHIDAKIEDSTLSIHIRRRQP